MYTVVAGNIGADVIPVIAILMLLIIVMVTVMIIAVIVAVIKRLVNLYTDCSMYKIKHVFDFMNIYHKLNVACVYILGLHYDS